MTTQNFKRSPHHTVGVDLSKSEPSGSSLSSGRKTFSRLLQACRQTPKDDPQDQDPGSTDDAGVKSSRRVFVASRLCRVWGRAFCGFDGIDRRRSLVAFVFFIVRWQMGVWTRKGGRKQFAFAFSVDIARIWRWREGLDWRRRAVVFRPSVWRLAFWHFVTT